MVDWSAKIDFRLSEYENHLSQAAQKKIAFNSPSNLHGIRFYVDLRLPVLYFSDYYFY